MNDPHGYGALRDELTRVEQRLLAVARIEEAQRVQEALGYFGVGSPSEFLGESRMALASLAAEGGTLPEDLVQEIRRILENISAGFRAAGGRD